MPDIVQPFALVFEIAGAGDGVFAASDEAGLKKKANSSAPDS